MVGVCGAPAEVNDARHELLSLPISDNTYTASEKRKKRKKQPAGCEKAARYRTQKMYTVVVPGNSYLCTVPLPCVVYAIGSNPKLMQQAMTAAASSSLWPLAGL